MSIPLPSARRWLRRASLVYLGLPVAIFFVGWLRAPLAAGFIALLLWSVWRAGWGMENDDAADGTQRLRIPVWALCAGGIFPAVAVVAMSGAGGWGAGDSDWFKHDTVLHDLVTRPWPVAYGTSSGTLLLVYYTAFYLPAGLVGKWTGSYFVASQILAATMLVGTLLALAWLSVLGQSSGTGRQAGWWRACALFFGFAGMDVLGKAAVNLALGLPAWNGDWSDIEWWAQAFQYSSNAAALFWAPQHAIGAWLPTALVLDLALFRKEGHSPGTAGGLPVTLTLFWAPFAAVGLAPYVAFCGCARGGGDETSASWKARLGGFVTARNLSAAALAAPVLFYYAARSAKFAVPAIADVVPGRSPMPLLEGHPGRWWIVYGLFVLMEFGVLAGALAGSLGGASGRERRLLWIAVLVLLALPTVHYGYANDLVMRGGLPALWTLQVLVLRRFYGVRRWARTVGVLVFAIGACNAGLEYRRHLLRMRGASRWRDESRAVRPGEPPAQSLFQLQRTLYSQPGFDFARQYLGSQDTVYGRWLAPQATSPPPSVAE